MSTYSFDNHFYWIFELPAWTAAILISPSKFFGIHPLMNPSLLYLVSEFGSPILQNAKHQSWSITSELSFSLGDLLLNNFCMPSSRQHFSGHMGLNQIMRYCKTWQSLHTDTQNDEISSWAGHTCKTFKQFYNSPLELLNLFCQPVHRLASSSSRPWVGASRSLAGSE